MAHAAPKTVLTRPALLNFKPENFLLLVDVNQWTSGCGQQRSTASSCRTATTDARVHLTVGNITHDFLPPAGKPAGRTLIGLGTTHTLLWSKTPCRFFPNMLLAAKTFMGRGLGPKNNVGSAPVSIFSFFDPEGLLPCWVRG